MEIPPATTQIFLFYNPLSGNRQGEHLKTLHGQHCRMKERLHVQIQMYDITNPSQRQTGMMAFRDEYIKGTSDEIHLMVAGGDGTLSGLLRELLALDVDITNPRITFSIFPFGNGNDCSQSLGWGRTVKRRHTLDPRFLGCHIFDRLDATRVPFDIWRVHISASAIISNGKPIVQEYSRLMTNYMTVGLQGLVGMGFEKKRHKSRAFNILEYTWQTFKRAVVRKHDPLDAYLHDIEIGSEQSGDRELHTIRPKYGKCVELLLQNIPGIWGRQVDLWNTCTKVPATCGAHGKGAPEAWNTSNTSDGLLEVYGIRSKTDYFLKQMPCTRKIQEIPTVGQYGHGLTLEFKSTSRKVFMMIDGEFFKLLDPRHVVIHHLGRIIMTRNGK